MKLSKLKIKNLLICLVISLLYPLFSYISSDNKLLSFINALTITGLVFLVIGIVISFVMHGDLDITQYVATRWMHRKAQDYHKTYEKFKADKNAERESSFNYPLFVGICQIAAAIILTAFY